MITGFDLMQLQSLVESNMPSRLERIATAALQGLLAGGPNGHFGRLEKCQIIGYSMNLASQLIAELDKEK